MLPDYLGRNVSERKAAYVSAWQQASRKGKRQPPRLQKFIKSHMMMGQITQLKKIISKLAPGVVSAGLLDESGEGCGAVGSGYFSHPTIV